MNPAINPAVIRCISAVLRDGASFTAQGAVPLVKTLVDNPRMARADQLMRTACSAVETLQHLLADYPADRNAVIGCTTLATLRANVRYERRRIVGGIAAPRDFARTAANGWIGEITAAYRILGPCSCLVGPESALQAVATGVCLLSSAQCEQVLVIAAESLPETPEMLEPHEKQWETSAACLLMRRPADTWLPAASCPSALATVSVNFAPNHTESCPTESFHQDKTDLHPPENTIVHVSSPTDPSVCALSAAYRGVLQNQNVLLKSESGTLEISFFV